MRFGFNSKGQASLEFILVLVFMLVVVSAVIVPLGQRLQFALEDISRVGSVSAAHARIQMDVDTLLSTPSESLLVRDIYLPKGSSLKCDPVAKKIETVFSLNRSVFRLDGSVHPDCVQNTSSDAFPMTCTKTLLIPSTVQLTCQGSSAQSFVVDTGAAGFTQRFSMGSTYTPGPSPFVIDFSTG